MKRLIIIISIILVTILLLLGCASNADTNVDKGLKITSLSTGIGGNEKNLDEQVFTYSVCINNYDNEEVLISSVEPVLNKNFSKRIIDKNLKKIIGKSIKPNSFLVIEGQIKFNAKGSSKTEIVNLEPFVSSFKIVSEKLLTINNR